MAFFKFNNIKISAVAACVPKTVVNVDSFAESFGKEYVEKFKESTGVKQYRKTRDHQTASDLCFASAEKILTEKNVDRSEVKALIFVAHSTDYRRPATACVLHKRLGLNKDCVSFDVNLGCSAFVYGLQIICSLMQNSDIDKALLLVGETLTKMTNPKDSSVSMIFGDGGSAVLLEKSTDNSCIQGVLKTDGNGYQDIIAPAGGYRNMNATHEDFVWKDGNTRNLYNTVMRGDNVFSFTISAVPRTIKEFLTKTETTVDDYECFAFHQANKFITGMLAKKLKVDMGKFPICLDRFGNTSAPAIPLTICDKYGSESGSRLVHFLMCGFGVGLSWGVCSASINVSDIYPVIESDDVFEEGIINSPNDFLEA
ncbi:3-oxoacyl-ACP synthase [Fibrobacter sp. UWB2]|uniref:3-oxoacyl-ACP synthase III family protein n=1 Tax=Fibrobacter sp. UWB2 TaxID=1964358 RepID=UPI000B525402|nr:ketoacyl-ACP synthase III [Fibrobacter sp. UWB2]OWV24472.1 3-oxoacyl-ACP synthase [Fibrobacter sp. UWB2]